MNSSSTKRGAGRSPAPSLQLLPPDLVRALKRSQQFAGVLEDAIALKLMEQAAQAEGIQITPEDLQVAANDWRKHHQLWSQAATLDWLTENSWTLDDLEDFCHHKILKSKLQTTLFSKKINPFYFANRDRFTEACLYEITLTDADLALELYYALAEQEITFAQVAEQYCQDLELRRAGGYRGRLSCRQLPKAIATAIFAAQPPQLLKPIPIGKQYHLIYLLEKQIPDLDAQMQQTILDLLFQEWLANQRKMATVEVNLT